MERKFLPHLASLSFNLYISLKGQSRHFSKLWNIPENIRDGSPSAVSVGSLLVTTGLLYRVPQGKSVFVRGTGRSTMLQWEATDPKVYGQHKLY